MLNKEVVRVFFLVWLLALSSYASQASEVVLKNGVADLSGANLDETTVQLSGDAWFYWNAFLQPEVEESIAVKKELISLKQSWNNQSEYTSHPVFGYGSYRFTIRVAEKYMGKKFVLRPNHFISYASEIYVNDVKVSYNGSVGNEQRVKSSRKTTSIPFLIDSTNLDVIIHVANYKHFRGGIFRSLDFGLAENTIDKREREIMIDLVVILSLLIMFLYHLILYMVNSKDRLAFYFSLTCLVFAIDLSLQDTMSFFLFFPNASFSWYSVLQTVMPFTFVSAFLFFLDALFPKESSKLIRNISLIVTVILVSLVLGFRSNPDVQQAIIKPHFLYVFLIVFYAYYIVIKALINRRDGAILFLIAYSIFSACAITDLFSLFDVINTPSLVSSGLLAFVFLTSILQGKRMSNLLRSNSNLAVNLKALNVELEEKVETRTAELNDSLIELKRLNAFKEEFTNTIVHDLKTPLGAIINSNFFRDEEVRSTIVKQSGYRILGLVNNILDVYKYENTKIQITSECIDLVTFFDQAQKEVLYNAADKALIFENKGGLNLQVDADKQLIHRVFVNLFANAVAYSPRKGTICVSAEAVDEDTIRVSVKNSGPGISKENQKRIFERFVNLGSDQVANSTGLGLTYCKMVVEAHGCTIGVISESDNGVEFWFTLPICKNAR